MKKRGRLASNVRVLLAGRERDRLYSWLFPRWASWLGVNESLVRLGTVKDMPTLYHAADVLVLPSLWEGLPNVVLEGQASALPAVVSHAANVDKIVLDGVTGFEVPTFDGPALANALERIVDVGTPARQEMGRKGREHVMASFSPERVLRETVALYDALIAEKGLSPCAE
jgi:glycosyltransferase involved in cell wall biosynthesis